MPSIKTRVVPRPFAKHRTNKRISQKIIFLSCEGSVTEEEYIDLISELFSEVEDRIKLVSVAEDATHTRPKCRTPEQNQMLGKNRPKQLVDRIPQFKIDREETFQFTQYPEDEFWIVTDVDKNWSDEEIPGSEGKTYMEEWNEAVALCHERGYHYAVSNPFFEMWLLLHHAEVEEMDKTYAVTASNQYQKTTHFQERLQKLGVPLKDKKHITKDDYTVEKVNAAITRAEELHLNKDDMAPNYYATTVYLLMKKIRDMLSEINKSIWEV